MNKLRALVATVAMSTAAVVGCGGGGEATITTVPDRAGSVTLRWSVDGSFDPSACDAFAVESARIDLYDANGNPFSTTFIECRAFSSRIDLAPGRYSARIEMVDVDGTPRSTSLAIQPFTIVSGTNLNIDSDFPRDSFF